MCGIYGFSTKGKLPKAHAQKIVKSLIDKVQKRGSDGIGILLYLDERVEIHKSFLKPSEFVKTSEMEDIVNSLCNTENSIFIVQGRLATSGAVNLMNQHPLELNSLYLFHNGIFLETEAEIEPEILSDSWALLYKLQANLNTLNASVQNFSSENSFALLDLINQQLTLGSNTGSMFLSKSNCETYTVFGSEPVEEVIMNVIDEYSSIQIRGIFQTNLPLFAKYPTIQQYEMGKIIDVDFSTVCEECGLTSLSKTHFDLMSSICLRCEDLRLQNNSQIREKKTRSDLVDLLANKRVVVGFSGGRDSSYALGKLADIPGIELIAVSYDWGGVTDLGRRNQSRVCGILGIEHVWIAADIEKKRSNVRKNLLAWCQKPSLSTIPLMLAGDKAMWKYPLTVAKKRDADFVIYCTNPLERTDFKVALAGVKSRSKSHRPQVIRHSEKLILLFRYGLEILRNPKLFNSSLLDSLAGFKYYFFDSAKNIQYFDYEEWNEDKVNSYLREKFDWEFRRSRNSSWRIGDITTPFYNYAYYSALGFTEFDTLRANQVRSGHITKETAELYLVLDNIPDLKGISEYSQCMGVSELTLMRGIERLTRKTNN